MEIRNLAKQVADATNGWGALRMLLGDIAALARALRAIQIRSVPILRNAGRSVLEHVNSRVAGRGARLTSALRGRVDLSGAPKAKWRDFVGVDAPAELERHLFLSTFGSSF